MFKSISACDTWNCFNSFALWVSSIGTVSVSVIALWLSVKDRFLHMINIFDTAVTYSIDPAIPKQNLYSLNFTNIGVRPITVINYKWKIPLLEGKGSWVATFSEMDSRVSLLCTKLPYELTDGKSGEIFSPENFIQQIEKKQNFLYSKSIMPQQIQARKPRNFIPI